MRRSLYWPIVTLDTDRHQVVLVEEQALVALVVLDVMGNRRIGLLTLADQ